MGFSKTGFDRPTWNRFKQAVKGFFRSEVRGKAIGWLVGLIACMCAINGLNVVNSYVGRDFVSAIVSKNWGGFVKMAFLYIFVFGGITVVAVFYRYTEERLGLLWRESLTRQLATSYLDTCVVHHPGLEFRVANPDQRISEDVKAFTTTTLSFVLMLSNGTFTVLAFSGVLWSISPLLFCVAVAYATMGSVFAVFLGKKLIGLNYRQLDREANFRSDLIHLREHAESVSITNRGAMFQQRLGKRINDWAGNARRIMSANRDLSFFTTGYNYMIQIIPALIVAPLFFKGQIEFGVITQSAMAFAQLLGAFSLIVTQFQSISSFAAVIQRLTGLADTIAQARQKKAGGIEYASDESGCLAFEGLTLRSADDSVLLKSLDFRLRPGMLVLVNGGNKQARVVLFRATAELWDHGTGTIIRPAGDRIFFIPERPYIPPTTLREALQGPGRPAFAREIELMLAALGLEGAVERAGGLDQVHDWDETLTLAEQHLFGCARLLLSGPVMVVFDRPGTALNGEELTRVLRLLREAGIGCLTLGRSGESGECYDGVLHLDSDALWRWEPKMPGCGAVPQLV
jgi:putative ATP-binding cassette transporter